MPFDNALTSPEIDYVRARVFEPRLYLSVCSNTVVYTARLGDMDAGLYPTAEFPVTGGSGTPSDIEIGMVAVLCHTNDPFDYYWRGRIRDSDGVGYILSGGAGVVFTNQTGDLGFTAGDYLFVIRDYAVMEKLPRASGGLPHPDWNVQFRELLPIIANLRDHVKFADPDSGVLTLSFAPSCLAATDGAIIDTDTYDWLLPASGVTITVGSTSAKDITVEIDPADAEYWFKFSVTDDGGRTSFRRFKVFAHDDDHMPTVLSFSDLSVRQEISTDILDGNANGYSAKVKAFRGVESILDNTAVLFWTDQYYDGDSVDIGSAGNIVMAGRLRSEVNNTGYISGQRKSSASFEIEGVLGQLARLRFPPIRVNDSTDPTAFNDVRNLTLWRAIWLVLSEYSTFTELHSLVLDDFADCYYRTFDENTQGGNLLKTVSDLAQSYDAILQDNQAGSCEVARRLTMLSGADRADVPIVLDLTMADFSVQDALDLTISHVKQVGLVKGDGGADHPDQTAPGSRMSYHKSRAPNGSPLGAAGDGRLPRQVLKTGQNAADEKAELSERTGNALAAMWGPAQLTLHVKDHLHFLTPDVQRRLVLTIPASETTRGRAYDSSTNWWLQSKQLDGDPQKGRLLPRLTFIEESMGTPGAVDNPPVPKVGATPVFGNPYPKLPIPPTTGNDKNTDIGDWSPNNDPTIDSSCVDGTAYIDTQYDIGEVVTVNSVTIGYTATATLTGYKNKVLLRAPGESYVAYASWNTQAGSNTITLNVGAVAAEFIEIIAFGDDDGCVDSISITSITYNAEQLAAYDEFYDFTIAPYGWVAIPAENANSTGVWQAGYGFHAVLQTAGIPHNWQIHATRAWMPRKVTEITYHYNIDDGESILRVYDSPYILKNLLIDVGTGVTSVTFTYSPAWSAAAIGLCLITFHDDNTWITGVRVKGYA